jgi:hypothetical protein
MQVSNGCLGSVSSRLSRNAAGSPWLRLPRLLQSLSIPPEVLLRPDLTIIAADENITRPVNTGLSALTRVSRRPGCKEALAIS